MATSPLTPELIEEVLRLLQALPERVLRGREEIGEYLGLSKELVSELVASRIAPFYRMGNRPTGILLIDTKALRDAITAEGERQRKAERRF